MPASARFRTLPSFKVKGLNTFDKFRFPAKPSRGQFIEVSRVFGLLFIQHATLARTYTCARHLRTTRERCFGFLRQRAKAHVRDKERDIQLQGLRGTRPNGNRCGNIHSVQQRLARHLCR